MSQLDPVLIIVLLIAGIVLSALVLSVTFYIWIYKDAKVHGEKGALWLLLAIFTSPVIGWLAYMLAVRRQEFVRCHVCGRLIQKKARYCENCGSANDPSNPPARAEKLPFWHYFIPGIVSFLLMLVCTGVLIFYCFSYDGQHLDNWFSNLNTGYVVGNMENHWNNSWTIKSKSSSDGYHHDADFKVKNPETETLLADISSDGGELTLYLTQGDIEKSFDVSELAEAFSYPLTEFEPGKLHIRLERKDADNLRAKIEIP